MFHLSGIATQELCIRGDCFHLLQPPNKATTAIFKYEMSYCMYVACMLYVVYVFRPRLSLTVTVTSWPSQAGTCVTQWLAAASAAAAGRRLHDRSSDQDSDQ